MQKWMMTRHKSVAFVQQSHHVMMRLGHSGIATETSSNLSEMEIPNSSTPVVLDYHCSVEVQHASHTEVSHALPSRNTDISFPLISNDTSVLHLDSIDTPHTASELWSPGNVATAKSKLNIRAEGISDKMFSSHKIGVMMS